MKFKSFHILEILLVAALIGGGLYLSIPNFVESQKLHQIHKIQRVFDQIQHQIVNDPKLMDQVVLSVTSHNKGDLRIDELKNPMTNSDSYYLYRVQIDVNDLMYDVLQDSPVKINEELCQFYIQILCGPDNKKINPTRSTYEFLRKPHFVALYTSDINSKSFRHPVPEFQLKSPTTFLIHNQNIPFDISNGLHSSGSIYVDSTSVWGNGIDPDLPDIKSNQ